MQPLQLPQSFASMNSFSPQAQQQHQHQASPAHSQGWKLFHPSAQARTGHASYSCSAVNPIMTSAVASAFYQAPAPNPQPVQPPQSVQMVQMDPWTFTELQYQLQFERLFAEQQRKLQQLQLQSTGKPNVCSMTSPTTNNKPKTAENDESEENDAMDMVSLRQAQNIEKIYLNGKFVSRAVFDHLSREIPRIGANETYEGFFVSSKQTGQEWDLVLKIMHKDEQTHKTNIKYYLAHKENVLHSARRSDLCIQECTANPQCVCVELELPLVLFEEFDHVISYLYGQELYLGDTHLIALYVLMERLKINGGLLEGLYREIKRFCDKYRCVSYLLKSEELSNEELIWLCGDAILQNLSFIAHAEWLSIPLTAFRRLIFQAVNGGIGGKYSEFIVCELIVQYVKSIMSESHRDAREVVTHLETTEIASVSIDHCLPMIKMIDVLFCEREQQWRVQHIAIYRLAMQQLAQEFTPYHNTLCQQLQGLSPITFASMLVMAPHLEENALGLSLLAYKDGNHASYFNDRRLRVANILRLRECGQQATPVSAAQEQDAGAAAPAAYQPGHGIDQAASKEVQVTTASFLDLKLDMDGEHACHSASSMSPCEPAIISPLEWANNECTRSQSLSLSRSRSTSRSPTYSVNSDRVQYAWSPEAAAALENESAQECEPYLDYTMLAQSSTYQSPLNKRANHKYCKQRDVNALISKLTQ